jgi:hypothetical protein
MCFSYCILLKLSCNIEKDRTDPGEIMNLVEGNTFTQQSSCVIFSIFRAHDFVSNYQTYFFETGGMLL